jgi:hypothetical protein
MSHPWRIRLRELDLGQHERAFWQKNLAAKVTDRESVNQPFGRDLHPLSFIPGDHVMTTGRAIGVACLWIPADQKLPG